MSKKETEPDPKFDQIVSAIESLEVVALEHENRRTGPHRGECVENRSFIIAMAMHRLNLSVGEIGLVAEYLFDIECEHEADKANAAPPDSSDDVLNANSLSGM